MDPVSSRETADPDTLRDIAPAYFQPVIQALSTPA
jgi:hypothetical protein